jgi:dienelactone hydrolase
VKFKLSPVLLGLLLIESPARSQDVPSSPLKPPAEVRVDFLKLLDRPRVPLDAKSRVVPPIKGLPVEHVDFTTETRPDGTQERVPALVVRPEGLKPGETRPAVIVLHGTGGTKEGNRSWLERLAARGFVAIAIDGRYHGERLNGQKGTKAYNEAIIRAWRAKPGEPQAHPFYYDTCWDIWRTIDYLQTRPDVDPDRIGMIGTSKGGIETWLAAAVDERVKVAVPCIGVQSFRWSLEHDRWQARANTIKEAHEAAAKDLGEPSINARVCRELWNKVIPGILDEFDGPSMLRLFAGRSLLVLNGDRDPNCPLGGVMIALESAQAAFHAAKADDHLKVMLAWDTGHAVTKEQEAAATDWFVRWLKPESSSPAK